MNQTAHTYSTFCALDLEPDANVPEWIELIPAGRITGRDDRVLINDRPDLVVERFDQEGIDIVFDYEHLSEVSLENKSPTPAAGWIKALENRSGAIWAQVDWTAKAREMIAAREYRHFSPALLLDAEAQAGVEAHIRGLSSAGLVHSPFLRSAALNSKQTSTPPTDKGVAMKDGNRITLCQRLGLADEASDAAVLSAVTTLNASADKANDFDPAKFVPVADYEAVKTKLSKLEDKAADDLKSEAEAAVDAAIKAEQIAPGSKDYHLSACSTREGLDQFKALMGTTGKMTITQPTDLDKKDPKPGKVETLSANQKAIAKNMGLSEKDYLSHLNGEEA